MSNSKMRLDSIDLEKLLYVLKSQFLLLRSVGKYTYLILSFVLTVRDDLCKAISTSTDV